MRFHIGLSLNWKTLKKWIIPILIGLLLFLGLGSANAETLDDSTPWTIIRYQNASGSTLITYNCPDPNAYSKDYCSYDYLYPSNPSDYKFQITWRFTTQPFVFKANTEYKLIIYSDGAVDYSKIKIMHELSDGSYSSYYTPKNVSISGSKITLTIEYSSNVSAKTIDISLPLLTNGDAGEHVSMSISRNFTIYDIDDSDSVIIDQNESIMEQNKETNEKLDDLKDTIIDQNNSCHTSKNLFNINNLVMNKGTVDNSKGTVTVNGYANPAVSKLITVAPSLVAGKTYTLNFKTTGTNKFIYLVGSASVWVNNTSRTLTQAEINGVFSLYGVDGQTVVISDIQIVEGTSVPTYEPFGEICSNLNEERNELIGDINDSLNNSNVDSGTGNDFFNNFQTEDNGGISGIITAPLTLINSLLDNQNVCTDLTFPILGKEVSIPSGCIIWDKVPNEMELLIQTLVCGTGAYFLLKQLFKDIEKLKNPNNSEVSTLDL